ncbi:MAG: hypothetical protein HOC56_01160, partial [Anaerolineae bacterium]|nr:hypothetical protein [Anaerolineae bacterium]
MTSPKADNWESPQKVLVILAHPDDAEFFCGATLARWAKAGHEVAWEQFEYPFQKEKHFEASQGSALEVQEDEMFIKIRGEGFTYSFDKKTGLMFSMIIQGKELIRKGPLLNVWRAPLANDLDSWNFWHTEMGYVTEGMGRETANGWRSTGLDRLSQDVDLFST